MADAKKLLKQLSGRGPHRVLKGDLGLTGVPGEIYTPESGSNLPALAFAHDWLTPTRRYKRTLEHLASWGIVVAAPDTQRGPLPSDAELALDLATAVDVITQVKLGTGNVTVNRARRAVAGDGFGVGAAVLAAAGDTGEGGIAALAALFPSPTSTQVGDAAHALTIPALLLAADGDAHSMGSNAGQLSQQYGGPIELRLLKDGKAGGLAEGLSVRGALGAGGSDKKTQKAVRALLTGFILGTVGEDSSYKVFTELGADLPDTVVWDPHAEPVKTGIAQKVRGLI